MNYQGEYHLARGKLIFGPYSRELIEEYLATGALLPDDFVWTGDGPGWISLAVFLSLEGPAISPDPVEENPRPRCDSHVESPAFGHCHKCGKFLCVECLRYKAGGFYCPDCQLSAKGETEKSASGFMERVMLELRERPVAGIGLVMALAAFLFLLTGAMRQARIEGATNPATVAAIEQAERALMRGNFFSSRNESDRSARWLRLALASTDRAFSDGTLSSSVKARVLALRLRAALETDNFSVMENILYGPAAELSAEFPWGFLDFHKACNNYLHHKDYPKAAEIFEGILSPEYNPALAMREFENNMRLMEELNAGPTVMGFYYDPFNVESAEIRFRLGECYLALKKKKKAAAEWSVVAEGMNEEWKERAEARLIEENLAKVPGGFLLEGDE